MATNTKVRASKDDLKALHATMVSLEKVRIALGNRVSAMKRGVDTPLVSEFWRAEGEADPDEELATSLYPVLYQRMKEMEELVDDAIMAALPSFAVWDAWLMHVKGIGPSLAGQMLAMLLPPLAGAGPSTWYKAAGLNPELRPDGEMRLPRPRAYEDGELRRIKVTRKFDDDGEALETPLEQIVFAESPEAACAMVGWRSKDCDTQIMLTYYPRLRVCLYRVADSFIKVGAGGYYRRYYDDAKVALQESRPGWPPHRLNSVARWKMIKRFLAHLYEKWAEAEGIDNVRRAYVLEVLGHQHYEAPPEFIGAGKI